MNNLPCPKCNKPLEYSVHLGYGSPDQIYRCEDCNRLFIICHVCSSMDSYDELEWLYDSNRTMCYKKCNKCNSIFYATKFIVKSNIYKCYHYAFKFVNRTYIPYPFYFYEDFPLGSIEEDLGEFCNDFLYAGNKDKYNLMMGTDPGTARAYRIKIDNDSNESCVALSHETGLELFLISVGSFIGLETSKFILEKYLRVIEKKLNDWWKKTKKKDKSIWNKEERKDPLVTKIQIRTPYWEINIDGTFSKKEKIKLFNLIQNSIPINDIDKFLDPLGDRKLSQKIKSSTKKIAKRK